MGYLIGVDVGSQSIKAVLTSAEGKVVATASHSCSMEHPASGWSEQDPAQWREGLATTVQSVLAQSDLRTSEVSHIGLACQVDGVVPVDRDLQPLRAAIIWLDRRATAQAQRLVDRVGIETIFKTSGLNPDASHIAPKMMWLRDEEPEVYRNAALLLPVGAYLLAWLTGQVVQDHANASSTLLYDVTARRWSEMLLDAAGIDGERLAPLAEAHEPVGPLTAMAAERLGLTRACVAVVGTGDDHAAVLGAGIVAPGVVADVTGTAEPVAAVAIEAVFDPKRLVETHAHAVARTILVENPGFVSGGSTKWLASLLGGDQRAVFEWAGGAKAGSDGVTFLPTLSGATAPRWNDRMRGTLDGLSMNHDRRHLSRAVLEGCAYALRDITDRLGELGLGGREIRVVGGGSRSRLWMQIKADVCGLPIRPVLGSEATAVGAAMLAAVGAGVCVDVAQAAEQMTELAGWCFEPDPADSERYEDSYRRYRRLFDAIEEVTA